MFLLPSVDEQVSLQISSTTKRFAALRTGVAFLPTVKEFMSFQFKFSGEQFVALFTFMLLLSFGKGFVSHLMTEMTS